MNNLNRVTLLGNLGKDQKIEKGENAHAQLSLATHTIWKDKNGEYKQSTEWHSIKVFNESLLETVVPKLRKGDLVFIEGSLRTRKWLDKIGNPHHTSEVIVGRVTGKILLLKGSLEVLDDMPLEK